MKKQSSILALDFRDKESWEALSKKYHCTIQEAKEVSIRLMMRGVTGNFENELSQLDKGPYSNEPNEWFDSVFRSILVEMRIM